VKEEEKSGARPSRRALGVLFLILAATMATVTTASAGRPRPVAPAMPAPWVDSTRVSADSILGQALDSLFGLSGVLRVKLISDLRILEVGPIARLFGGRRVEEAGVYPVGDTATKRSFSLITLLPFTAKSGGKVGSYLVGSWPGERRAQRPGGAYVNPAGFIRVTEENQNTQVSEHFRLRDFLTKDQQNVWPKYLVLREPLVDKLELIIQDLARRGVNVKHMTVMSGFRTPQYNQRGVGKGGRAVDSRHQLGDAADVFVDNDGNGRMDDLNRDGRVDHRDVQVILDAAERIERAHPTLVGGGGLYRATRAHGPFAHIDVRGSRARWGT
jgi:hypothetical protein